jgi:uncharacterized protein (TIGR02996 family)
MTDEDIARERAAFMAMIRADPANEDNRLVFSDWCETVGLAELAEMLRGGSRQYLENFAARINPNEAYDLPPGERKEHYTHVSFEELMDAAAAVLDGDKDADTIFLGFDTPDFVTEQDEFWKHFEVMTGRARTDEDQRLHFRCAC